jgi:hypothetical protein
VSARSGPLAHRRRRASTVALLGALTIAPACGGSGGSPTAVSSPTVNNVQPLQVNFGPAGDYTDGLFTSVTICVPGTSSCQTIDGVLVDSGSEGLRLLSSQVTLPLPRTMDAAGNPLANCASFADMSYAWGPMAKASVRMAGEQAASVPIQLIGDAALPDAPADCSGGGTAADTVTALGANGLLGIGVFREDCGPACARSTGLPPIYYSCPSAGCSVTSVPVASQLQNPVWLFAQDNNGFLISLPAVPELGARSVAGSLIFGIGTQANNALGSARVYTTDDVGNFSTTFNASTLSGYLDTGTNGFYFLDSTNDPLPPCPDGDSDFSCPPSTTAFSATNTGRNGTSGPVSFNVANAEILFATGNAAFNDLSGPDTGDFDWGLPFFFGRNTFVAIDGQSTPGGTGPYWAY